MSRARCAVLAVLAALLLLPIAARAQSQATTGVIEGTVSYEKGPLPGATVVVKNTATPRATLSLATRSAVRVRAPEMFCAHPSL